jgi:hypothetical protein
MKQTAVEKMIRYFIEQKNNGVSHWCINDLIAQLYQAKAMEKEQIIDAYTADCDTLGHTNAFNVAAEQYYNETFKSE